MLRDFTEIRDTNYDFSAQLHRTYIMFVYCVVTTHYG